jgi:hypothetical protein
MKPLNQVVSKYFEPLDLFFNRICEVEDFHVPRALRNTEPVVYVSVEEMRNLYDEIDQCADAMAAYPTLRHDVSRDFLSLLKEIKSHTVLRQITNYRSDRWVQIRVYPLHKETEAKDSDAKDSPHLTSLFHRFRVDAMPVLRHFVRKAELDLSSKGSVSFFYFGIC